jgi:hypothetical protein
MPKTNIKIPIEMYLDRQITRADISTYSALYYYSENRVCTQSLRSLLKTSKISMPRLINSIHKLDKLDYIIVRKHNFKPTTYILVPSKLLKALKNIKKESETIYV